MLYQEIKAQIQKDLNIKERRARVYTKMFADEYKGLKEAISSIAASYTNEGLIKITYVINDNKHSIVLENKSIYAEENNKRKKVNQ